jgi:cobalt-zinc-cadmium efflux system membrane fusion protein
MRKQAPAWRKRKAWAAAAAVAAALLLAGCGHNSTGASQMTSFSESGDPAGQAQLFTVPQEQMAHVQVVAAQETDLPRVLRLNGTVAFNAFETTPVITQTSGPVSRILVAPGQYVRRGQPLAYVSSPDFSQSRAAYLKARAAYRLAAENLTRSQGLYAHHAIAQKDLQQAESDRDSAQADMQSAAAAMRVLGFLNPDEVAERSSPEAPILAPIGGEVVERVCAPGQVVQAGSTQCFTISNMSTVWVLANVYEDQLAYVHVGDPVTITSDAYPGSFQGRISYLGAALDPNSRTLQARIDVRNPQQKLKKDMFVVATVVAGKIPNALTVPDAAVLRDAENLPFVYVETGGGKFQRRAVKVGESQGGQTQIESGLKAGERVAGDGSLFLQFANSQK